MLLPFRTAISIVSIAAILGSSGCGEKRPAMGRVSGTVVYKDQPVEGAQVMFTSPGGRAAEGTTDATGAFTLTTFDPGDGALVGEHRVTVVKMIKQDVNDPYSATTNALPAQYSSADKTPLVHQVTAAGASDLRLELSDS